MPAANFDPIARPYRWLEYMSFGPWLGRCRTAQLEHLTGVQHALFFGDGDGRFLARLLAANPNLTADVVDSSHSMLGILDHRIRQNFIVGVDLAPGDRHRAAKRHDEATEEHGRRDRD